MKIDDALRADPTLARMRPKTGITPKPADAEPRKEAAEVTTTGRPTSSQATVNVVPLPSCRA